MVVLDPDTGRRVPARRVRRRTASSSTRRRRSARSSGRDGLSSFEGYYANPEADAERGRDGWYWTGDLGYRDDDGTFYFAGPHRRLAAGRRRELRRRARSSASLGRFPGVAAVVVYAVPDPRTGDQVMAALELDAGADVRPATPSPPSSPTSPTSAPSGRRGSCGSSTPSRSRPPARSTASRCGPSAGTRPIPIWWRPAAAEPYRRLDRRRRRRAAPGLRRRRPRRDARMRFAITHPLITPPVPPRPRDGRRHRRAWRSAAEAAGFHGFGFTDHPAPSQRWLEGGGHDALDPFVALGFAAAATDHAAADPEHRGAPLPEPVRGGQGRRPRSTCSPAAASRSPWAPGYLKSEFAALGRATTPSATSCSTRRSTCSRPSGRATT